MPSVDEVALGSDEEIEAHLRQLLRPGEDFELTLRDGVWIWLITLSPTEEVGAVSFDSRLALLDAFGWLWKRTQPAVSPIWQRRRELTREDVTRRATSSRMPDPEDLDPDEVRAVYGGQHSHREKKD